MYFGVSFFKVPFLWWFHFVRGAPLGIKGQQQRTQHFWGRTGGPSRYSALQAWHISPSRKQEEFRERKKELEAMLERAGRLASDMGPSF